MPFPHDSAWQDPHFPSLVVFYESIGDFFPSGHVAFPTLAYYINTRLENNKLATMAKY
jgi:hypothetical protein